GESAEELWLPTDSRRAFSTSAMSRWSCWNPMTSRPASFQQRDRWSGGYPRRLDAKIAERAGHAVHPQAAAFSMTQTIDHRARLRAAVDRDADSLLRHFDAGVKPPGGIRNGLDRGFVNARLVLAQLLPCVLRPGDVLHRVTARVRVVVCKSERAKVHRFESL